MLVSLKLHTVSTGLLCIIIICVLLEMFLYIGVYI